MKPQSISVIGLNYLGSSIALALKESALDVKIIGYDDDDKKRQQAKSLGIIDDARRNLVHAASEGDVVILSVPFAELEKTLRRIGDDVQPHALVLDMSRQKEAAQNWAKLHLHHGHFIGIVPTLAADYLDKGERGLEEANAGIFQNSVMCVIPSPNADPKAVDSAVNLGRLIGSKSFFLDIMEYDALAMASETLPGLLAAALFGAVNQSSGWRDILRFAGNNFASSTIPLKAEADIALMASRNKIIALHWIDQIQEQLKALSMQIRNDNTDELAAYMIELGIERERWLHKRSENNWEETVEIEPVSMVDMLVGKRFSDKEKS